MIVPLSQAPSDTPLIFARVADEPLARHLRRLGLSEGDTVTRMGGEAHAAPVRVRAAKGEVLLAAGMAAKVIVHHDDDHKTPVAEMLTGEQGHVEGLVCGTGLAEGLAVLGIREGDRLEMVRRIPPMDFVVRTESGRIILTEGMAAKLWGLCRGNEMQFAVAGRGAPFKITALIGGRRAVSALERMGLLPGVSLTLESVRPAAQAGRGPGGQTVLQIQSGLRLYLRPDQEDLIMVESD